MKYSVIVNNKPIRRLTATHCLLQLSHELVKVGRMMRSRRLTNNKDMAPNLYFCCCPIDPNLSSPKDSGTKERRATQV